MDNFLESPEFLADVQAACQGAMKTHGFAQSTYQSVEDLQQAVLLRFIKWLPRYKGTPQCKPVLFILARNLLRDAGRKDKDPRDFVDWENVDLEPYVGAPGKYLEAEILVHECMEELSDIQHQVVIEYRLKGRTSREVAKKLKVSAPTVLTHLKKAAAILDDCINRGKRRSVG